MTIIVLALAWHWGITAIIYGQVLASLVAYFINAHYTGVLFDYPITEQVRDFLPSLGLSVAMGLCVLLVGQLPFSTPLRMLSLQIWAGVFFFVFVCYILKIPAFMEAINILNGKWARL